RRPRHEDARDVEPLAAVVEKRAGGVGEVGEPLLPRIGRPDRQRIEPAVHPLHLDEAGEQARRARCRAAGIPDRSIADHAGEAGGAGRNSLDGFGPEADLFDEDSGRQVLGHGALLAFIQTSRYVQTSLKSSTPESTLPRRNGMIRVDAAVDAQPAGITSPAAAGSGSPGAASCSSGRSHHGSSPGRSGGTGTGGTSRPNAVTRTFSGSVRSVAGGGGAASSRKNSPRSSPWARPTSTFPTGNRASIRAQRTGEPSPRTTRPRRPVELPLASYAAPGNSTGRRTRCATVFWVTCRSSASAAVSRGMRIRRGTYHRDASQTRTTTESLSDG